MQIDPTIRKAGAEVWILWNPQLKTDFVQAELPGLLGDDCIIQHINYLDNPFLSDSAMQKAERLKLLDPDAYDHIYLGQPITDDDSAIIKYSWIEAAIDAHLKVNVNLKGDTSVGYDVADSGDDNNATVVFNGAICMDLDEWSAGEDELTESALRAWSKMPQKRGRFIYDAIGVGAHTGSTLKGSGQKGRVFKFLAGGAVIDPDEKYAEDITNGEKFENLKAQSWADVADRFRNTYNAVTKGHEFEPSQLISISASLPKLEQLKLELSTPKKRFSKRGLDMVETKDQLRARDVKSPNLADAFIMGACPHLVAGSIFDYSRLL
jgi:phage terminase large subunit